MMTLHIICGGGSEGKASDLPSLDGSRILSTGKQFSPAFESPFIIHGEDVDRRPARWGEVDDARSLKLEMV